MLNNSIWLFHRLIACGCTCLINGKTKTAFEQLIAHFSYSKYKAFTTSNLIWKTNAYGIFLHTFLVL